MWTMTKTAWWTRSLLMGLVCAAPVVAIAQAQSSEQPDDARIRVRDGDGRDLRQPGQGPGTGGNPGVHPGAGPGIGAGEGPGPDPRPAPFDPPTAEEWDRAEAFSKEHGPKRWEILQTLDEDMQRNLRGMVFWRFLSLERLRNSDPELYQIHLKRFSVEDEAFGIRFPIMQERRYPTEEERSKLREKAAAWVDLGLEERELRIQRLQDMLKREQDYMASEKGGRDAAIAERLAVFEQGRGMGLRRRRDGDGGGFAPPMPPPRRPLEQQQQPATQPAAPAP